PRLHISLVAGRANAEAAHQVRRRGRPCQRRIRTLARAASRRGENQARDRTAQLRTHFLGRWYQVRRARPLARLEIDAPCRAPAPVIRSAACRGERIAIAFPHEKPPTKRPHRWWGKIHNLAEQNQTAGAKPASAPRPSRAGTRPFARHDATSAPARPSCRL